jgi:hypothetical protein
VPPTELWFPQSLVPMQLPLAFHFLPTPGSRNGFLTGACPDPLNRNAPILALQSVHYCDRR